MVLYLRKGSVVCCSRFAKQQIKNTENYFAVIFGMNGIPLEKHLSANTEIPITVPLSQIRKKLDILICHKYQNSIVVAMDTVKE